MTGQTVTHNVVLLCARIGGLTAREYSSVGEKHQVSALPES